MPSRMDRLILGEIAGPFVFGVLLFTSLFFAGGELLRFAEFLGTGIPLATAARYLLFSVPWILAFTFPMAMLLAALLGFTRLSNDSEIVALFAAGASFPRIVAPVSVFALGVSLVGLWFNDSIVPAAQRGRHAIIDQARQGVGFAGTARPFDVPIRENGRLTMQVHVEGGVDLATGTLRNVSIEVWDEGQVTSFINADRAQWKFGTREWELFDLWAAGSPKNGSGAIVRGGSGRTVELGTPRELVTEEKRVEDSTIRDLLRRVQASRARGAENSAREAEVEVARRVALPFASLVFALVGAPLGVRPQRQGKGVGFGIAILITFCYWSALQFCSFLGQSGALPAGLALALPNLFGIAAAVYLIGRVLR